MCVREGGFEKRKGICLKTGLMLKAGPFLCRPNPVSQKNYSEKEICLDKPVVVSSV